MLALTKSRCDVQFRSVLASLFVLACLLSATTVDAALVVGDGVTGTVTYPYVDDGDFINEITDATWMIGIHSGVGTLNLNLGVILPDSVIVKMGQDNGIGTLHLSSGTDYTIRTMALTYSNPGAPGEASPGEGWMVLDGANLEITDSLNTTATRSGVGEINLNEVGGGSTLTTSGEVYLGAGASQAVVAIGNNSLWHSTGTVELGSSGQANVTISGGGTWTADYSVAGTYGVRLSGGDSAAGDGQTTIAIGGHAALDATWNLDTPAELSGMGLTYINVQNNGTWTATENLVASVTASGTGPHRTHVDIQTGGEVNWQKGFAPLSGTLEKGALEIDILGGTLNYGLLGSTDLRFTTNWVDEFTGGQLNIKGTGWILGTQRLPELQAGMSVSAPLRKLVTDLMPVLSGGTIDVDEVSVTDNWTHTPSGTDGLTYNLLTLDSGHMTVNGDFDARPTTFIWNSVGGTLEVTGELTMKVETSTMYPAGMGGAYHFQERVLILDGISAEADLSDRPSVFVSFSTGGGGVQLRNGARMTTGVSDVMCWPFQVSSDAQWVTTGETRVYGQFGPPALVDLDGGDWTSSADFNVLIGNAGSMGQVEIGVGSRWHAINSYILDGASTVSINGGTLEIGSGANPRDFDAEAMLDSYETGTLIVWGDLLGDYTLNAGAELITDHVAGTVTLEGGIVRPGHSPGASTFGGLDVDALLLGTLEMEIWGDDPGVTYDTLEVVGDLTLDGTLLIVLGNYSPSLGQEFDLFDWTWISDAADGEFAQIVFSHDGYAGTLDYPTGVLTITDVPEPASLCLLALGGLAIIRRRKK